MAIIKSHSGQADALIRNYLLMDPFIPYTSIISGIFLCKMTYNLVQLFSSFYFTSYNGLNKVQRIEWNNRGVSTAHATFISLVSLYLVFFSDVFSDNRLVVPVIFRSSPLSSFALGVSVGYFIADLGMMFWMYPSLGGMEYVVHHLLSLIGVACSLFTNEGQIYTFMVLISETTTPGINLRWYLDTAGMKRSKAYIINGVTVIFAWLVTRILLFVYLFYHVYLHYDQVEQLHRFAHLLVLVVPSTLALMNLTWFMKIVKGLRKQLAKKQ